MARTFPLIKEKTALIIVDMQNDFVRADAALYVPDAIGTVSAIQKLISFARENKMIVIWARFMSGNVPTLLWNWSPEIEQFGCCKRQSFRHYTDIDKTKECIEIIDELLPMKQPEDFVIDKFNYSAFRNTYLIDALRSEGRDTLIVAGTVTQICVEDTIHDAFAEQLKVVAASDAVSSFDDAQHAASLENVAMKYGMVMTTDEIITAYRN